MPRPRVELPEHDEPLDLNGVSIQPSAPGGRRVVEVPSNTQAVAIVEGTRRKLADLPLAPKHLNPIACVCLYTMFGLDTQEISVATGLPSDTINKLRMSNEYSIMQRAVVDTVLEVETGEVKDYLKKASRKAAEKVHALVDSTNGDIALRAARDVLDRSGHRPADVIEHRGRLDMGLVIEVVDRQDDEGRPIIDMEG